MKNRTGIIVFLLLLSTIAVLPGCGGNSLPTSVSTMTTSSVNSASFKSANGLSISLSLDSSTYQPGRPVKIIIDEQNTLSKTNKVPEADKIPSKNLVIDSPHVPSMLPFGIAIYKGNYNVSNYSPVTPLIIFDPAAVYIGAAVVGPKYYSFKPLSDIANINIPDVTLISEMQIKSEIALEGYWHDSNMINNRLIWFEPGIYTVVAGDEWGALVVVHFRVTE